MKICNKCGEEQPLSQFAKKGNGLEGYCKTCKSKSNKEYYLAHKDDPDFKQSRRKYQEDNSAAIREYQRQYQINNTERLAEQHKKYYEQNKEAVAAYRREWATTHRAQVNQSSRRYNIKRLEWELTGSFSQEEWIDLLIRCDSKCLRCKSDTKLLTVDHVIPLSKGGINIITNIQPLCGSCNSIKGAKTIDYRY